MDRGQRAQAHDPGSLSGPILGGTAGLGLFMTDNPVMSPAESLMWTVERDPILRSTFMTITLLDRAPDMDRLAVRIGDAMAGFPRMRQRVRTATSPFDRHRWIEDASFDLRYHIRHVALAPPGDHRSLF